MCTVSPFHPVFSHYNIHSNSTTDSIRAVWSEFRVNFLIPFFYDGDRHMSSTKERIANLATKSFGMDHAPDFDRNFSDAGVSSMDAIAFAKALAKEFGREIPADDFANFKNLNDIAAYLDS